MAQSPKMHRWLSQIVNELCNQYSLAKEPSVVELDKCAPGTVAKLLGLTKAILAAAPIIIPSTPHNREIVALRSPRGSMSAPASPKSGVVDLAPAMSLTAAQDELVKLRVEAHAVIQSVHHSQVPQYWRRLYTDVSILIVLAQLQGDPRATQTLYKHLVGLLDEAIVVAFAPGAGRWDMCHDAIARIQEEYLPLTDIASPSTANPGSPYPDCFEDNSTPPDIRTSKRPKRATRGAVPLSSFGMGSPPTPLPTTSTRQIPRLLDPPTLSEFKTKLLETPFIIPRYAADWPACTSWNNPQYLRMVGGLGRRVPVEISHPGQDYTSDQWTTTMMDWEEFLDNLFARSAFGAKAKQRAQLLAAASVPRPVTPVDPMLPRKRGRPPGSKTAVTLSASVPVEEWPGDTVYLAQHNLIHQFPELRSDIIIPDYVYSVPGPPPWYPSYQPPDTDDTFAINNWIGPKGAISPAHKDPYYNCYVQVIGKKTVWLAPPEYTDEMYPFRTVSPQSQSHKPESTTSQSTAPPFEHQQSFSSSPTHSAASDLSSDQSAPASTHQTTPPPVPSSTTSTAASTPSNSLHSNTSSVPIFDPPTDLRNRFPLFHDNVVQNASSAVLEPGDMLVIPPGWWHAMRTEETSASVSIWF